MDWQRAKVKVENGDKFLPVLVKAISPRIISMELRRPTLEDVFWKLLVENQRWQ